VLPTWRRRPPRPAQEHTTYRRLRRLADIGLERGRLLTGYLFLRQDGAFPEVEEADSTSVIEVSISILERCRLLTGCLFLRRSGGTAAPRWATFPEADSASVIEVSISILERGRLLTGCLFLRQDGAFPEVDHVNARPGAAAAFLSAGA